MIRGSDESAPTSPTLPVPESTLPGPGDAAPAAVDSAVSAALAPASSPEFDAAPPPALAPAAAPRSTQPLQASPVPSPASLSGATVSWDPSDGVDTPPDGDGVTGAAAPLRRVAQFVLFERLGAGGMGIVYAAFDDKLERKVAIKLVAAHAGGARAQTRLLREAQAQGRLSHPNVVTVYEVGTLPEGGLFIAMELVKGVTLRAWQKARPRSWRDVVAMYAAAGAGLAAAHRGGIVHRDFKPDNVLVGDDGRVRVADFGLAFASGSESDGDAPASEPVAGDPRSDHRPTLTAAGAVVGTPGYIAPEQFHGGTVDARTDQFSFCVALYEALHGERPFPDLAFARGARPVPRRTEPDPSYPRWVWDVVMRGLAIEPAQRFASMDALLTELTRSRERTRRRVLAAGALVGAMAIAGVTSAALTGRALPLCPRPIAELIGIWDGATKQRIRAAVLGTATPFAASVWASTEGALDRYAARWADAQQQACEATHVRHVQSAELLDRRTECLAGRRRSFAAATEVLQSQPAQAVAHAGEILTSLGDLALCADTGVLLALGPTTPATPATAARAAQIAEVRHQLARATALLVTGDVGGAAPIVTGASRLAHDLDDDRLGAEVRYAEGRVKLARGDIADSISLLNQTAELAVASHHDELSADAWLTLAVDAAAREQRPAEIERWLAQAEAWLRRLSHPHDPRAIDLESARGRWQLTAGDARTALVTLSHALDAAEALWGKDDPRLIAVLRDRSLVEARLRQAKPAVADAERALALGIAAWGPGYPDIARTRRALGLLYIEQLGAVDRGEHEVKLALELYSAQLGADSIDVANCEQVLAQVGQFRGDYASALQHAERADRIFAQRLGAEHPRRGETLMNLGVLRFMRQDFAGSLEAYQAAYPILRTALGTTHTTIGLLLSNTGETLLALGRGAAAQADFEQALEIMKERLGSGHVDLASPLKGLGLAHLSLAQPREAIAPLEQALALWTQSGDASDPQELAEIRWALARALTASAREDARARELARAALAGYRELGIESGGRAQEIARWLADTGRQ